MTGTNIHTDENLHSLNSDMADTSSSTSNIYEGDFVVRVGDGDVVPADPASYTEWDGIVPNLDRGDHLAEHEEDFTTPQYEGDGTFANSDRVRYAANEQLSVVHGWTPHDASAPAPSITRNDTVGIILMDGSAFGSARPVLVEEGYTADPDATGTPVNYKESNENFIPVGTAEYAQTDHDSLAAVQVE